MASDSDSSPDTSAKQAARKRSAQLRARFAHRRLYPWPPPSPLPTPLFSWLQAALEDDGKERPIPAGMPVIAEISGDNYYIDCVFTLVMVPGLIEDPFADPDNFYLKLHLELPPESGFLVFFQRSPSIVVATYEGWANTPSSLPLWIKYMNKGGLLRQPRMNGINILSYFCHDESLNNESIRRRVDQWCHVVSDVTPRSSNPMTIFFKNRAADSSIPQNPRSHKIRPWEVDAEEGNRIRAESIVQQSPSKSSGSTANLM